MIVTLVGTLSIELGKNSLKLPIGDCYLLCDHLFRLPFWADECLQKIHGCQLASPRYNLDELQLGYNSVEQTVLLTFGGLGLQQIPYDNLKHFPDWQLSPLIICSRFSYSKLLITSTVSRFYACGRVSKPGYGTFAKAVRLGLPIVTMTRGDFAGNFNRGIISYNQHQITPQLNFFKVAGNFLNHHNYHNRNKLL